MKQQRIQIFLGWNLLFLIPLSIMYTKTQQSIYLTVLMMTPLLAVILTKLLTKEPWKEPLCRIQWKQNYKSYLIAYFCPPLLMAVGILLYFILFPSHFDPLHSQYALELSVTSVNQYSQNLALIVPLAILVNPIMGLVPCFSEEIAWRGYLLPKLVALMGMKKAILVHGSIWGLWHSPIILCGYNYGNEHVVLGVLMMIFFCIVIGTICAFLMFKTQSIVAPTIFHAALNGIDLYAPATLLMSRTPNYFLGPNPVGVIGGFGFIIVALLCFHRLIKNDTKN